MVGFNPQEGTDMKWHSFPESAYMVAFGHVTNMSNGLAHLLFDAATFVDVEEFVFANCPLEWEILEIEKTFAYAKMHGGDNGERIDFSLGLGLKDIQTFHVDLLDIAQKDDEGELHVQDASWTSILGSALRRQVERNSFSKRT